MTWVFYLLNISNNYCLQNYKISFRICISSHSGLAVFNSMFYILFITSLRVVYLVFFRTALVYLLVFVCLRMNTVIGLIINRNDLIISYMLFFKNESIK